MLKVTTVMSLCQPKTSLWKGAPRSRAAQAKLSAAKSHRVPGGWKAKHLMLLATGRSKQQATVEDYIRNFIPRA